MCCRVLLCGYHEAYIKHPTHIIVYFTLITTLHTKTLNLLLPPFMFLMSQFTSFFKNLFIYFWLRWVFVAAGGLSLVAASGGYSSLWCAGFSLWCLLLLRSTSSRHAGFSSCGAQASVVVVHGLSSCGTRA